MGRWEPDIIYHDYGVDSTSLVRRHNDDIKGYEIKIKLLHKQFDAYEARIAELEAKVAEWEAHWEFEQGALAHEREQYTAELARVKAESLRVVRLPEAREHECTTATMGIIDDMIGFKDIDADWYLAPDWKNYTPETFDRVFTPVRLEHWETEE